MLRHPFEAGFEPRILTSGYSRLWPAMNSTIITNVRIVMTSQLYRVVLFLVLDQVLHGEKSVCMLERIRFDLANAAARRVQFEKLGRAAKRAIMISEGLIVDLSAADVSNLARDLAAGLVSALGDRPLFAAAADDAAEAGRIAVKSSRSNRCNSRRNNVPPSTPSTAGPRSTCAR